MKVIFFRLDYNSSIGGGHLKRCLSISKILSQKFKFIFLIEINEKDKNNIKKHLINKKNYQYFFTEKFFPKKEFFFLTKIKKEYKKVLFLFDISNIYKIKDINKVKFFFKKTTFIENKIIIDSVKHEALLPHLKKLKLGIVITPYDNVKKYFGHFKHFIGRKYFFYDPILKPQKKIKKTFVQNILISFGNSDKKKISLFCAKSLSKISIYYNIKIVVGPMFESNFTN